MGLSCFAQTGQDSLPTVDTAKAPVRLTRVYHPVHRVVRDTFVNHYSDSIPHTARLAPFSDSLRFAHHAFIVFTDPVSHIVSRRQPQGKEPIFYSIVALLLLFALLKNGFYRYMVDLFRVYFRTTAQQRQVKDQLTQSPLPSLLLNGFFALSGGLFIALMLQHFGLGSAFDFWLLFVYSIAGLAGIYSIKYVTLKFLGWIMQAKDATDTYIFVVFTTNKIAGILVLPFIVLLAFSSGAIYDIALTISICVMCGLFLYRYFLSYISIHRQVRISAFHFLLYLCAFEIAPLLLINKLLFRILIGKS
jgi:hypothetical protein